MKLALAVSLVLLIASSALASDLDDAKKSAELARILLQKDLGTGMHAQERSACFMLGVALVKSDFSEALIEANDFCLQGAHGSGSKAQAIESLKQFLGSAR